LNTRPLLALACLASFGCAPVAGPVVVEALVPDLDADGFVALDDVTLQTVVDLNAGRGERFDVRGDFKVNLTDLSDLGTDDFDAMVDRVRGDGGSDVGPHMHDEGGRYVADDFETLFYFTVFANFEAAFAAADLVGDTSRATGTADEDHAIVGMYASVVLSPYLPLPLLSADNAAYAAPVDGWLALRSAFQQGVPFAMHRGVIAHEFGHRLFFHNVFTSVDGGFSVWRTDNTETEPDEAQVREQMLIKGLDEGLADVFAMSAMGDKDAITRAFAVAGNAFVPEARRRDVEGDFAGVATYDNLRTLDLPDDVLESCGFEDEGAAEFEKPFNFYCVGTVVAAALWETAEGDPVTLRNEVSPAVLKALPKIGEALVNDVVFDLDVFLEPFVLELPVGRRRDAACTAVRARFSSLLDAGKVPSCS